MTTKNLQRNSYTEQAKKCPLNDKQRTINATTKHKPKPSQIPWKSVKSHWNFQNCKTIIFQHMLFIFDDDKLIFKVTTAIYE